MNGYELIRKLKVVDLSKEILVTETRVIFLEEKESECDENGCGIKE